MFTKILVANRGEIAVRIIRALREMQIESVAVYSKADQHALHAELADYAFCIGSNQAKDSYLHMQNIISTALLSSCEAIHPGYGFLSENATFAQMCKECGIVFIGPSASIIETMGNKANAKKMMSLAQIPVICGRDLKHADELMDFLTVHETPVVVKASAGGGGRGIRVINRKEDALSAFLNAKEEAKIAFGVDDLYVEQFITNARHIEVQLIGDSFGNLIHLGERDCSLQRRNQKMMEEAPAPHLSEQKRKEICETALLAAKAISYDSVGTVEFLYDNTGKFYFLEMNTRLQVEHPVSEMITGIDIVKEQIRVAAGLPLSLKQSDITTTGVSIECRINAERVKENFLPSPGIVQFVYTPKGKGVRVDDGFYAGSHIPSQYDSLLSKLIVHAKNREAAIFAMKRALLEYVIEGVDTNIDFLLELLNTEEIESGRYHIHFIQEFMKKLNVREEGHA